MEKSEILLRKATALTPKPAPGMAEIERLINDLCEAAKLKQLTEGTEEHELACCEFDVCQEAVRTAITTALAQRDARIAELEAAIIAYENSPKPIEDIFDWNPDDGDPPPDCPTSTSDWAYHYADFERAKRRDEMRALIGLPRILKPDDFRCNIDPPEPAVLTNTSAEPEVKP